MTNDNASADSLPEETAAFFGAGSPLRRLWELAGRPYEERPQQAAMAKAVADAFAAGENLCVEAPTGVGKSIAYLVPSIRLASRAGKPVVVTTATLALQDQLVKNDLPLLQELMGPFRFGLAKGRANYLCRRRLDMASGADAKDYLPGEGMASQLCLLAAWAATTSDGSLSEVGFEIDPGLRECVHCDASNCMGPKCAHNHNCFYWKARRAWDNCDVLVANHAIFLRDLAMRLASGGEDGLLPNYQAAVVDEAHHLEDEASRHMGLELSETALGKALLRLYDPSRARGLLARPGEGFEALRAVAARCMAAASGFFDDIRNRHSQATPSKTLRVRTPAFVEDRLTPPLAQLVDGLRLLASEVEDENYRGEIKSKADLCAEMLEAAAAFLAMERPEDHVYWLESGGESAWGRGVCARVSPVDVAAILGPALFGSRRPVVATSATLSVRGGLEHFAGRVGFRGMTLTLDTPFDFQSQVTVHVPRRMPHPAEKGYGRALSEAIWRYVSMTRGKAFVLFTSFRQLADAAAALRPLFEAEGLTLLVQGEGKSRARLIREFREDIDSVLFGAASFWTGVDVPGEALSNVIITKLPFSVPDEPLVEARAEIVERKGGNGFRDYLLPEAVLRFKQGVGRLIRTKTDKGHIVILDRRVATRSYGADFLASIPPCPVVFD